MQEVMRAEGIPVLVELLRRVPQRQGVTPEQAAILQLVCSILRVASENADAAHQIRCVRCPCATWSERSARPSAPCLLCNAQSDVQM